MKIDLKTLLTELPPIIARRQLDKVLPGIISSRHMANLDSRGVGPTKYKLGRTVFYRRDDLIEWLNNRISIEDK